MAKLKASGILIASPEPHIAVAKPKSYANSSINFNLLKSELERAYESTP